MKRLITTLAVAAMSVLGLSACMDQPTSYVPAAAAFGNSGLSQCYMPLGIPQSGWQAIEQQYIAHHYCQAGWTPIAIPQSTYMAYYPYYSSPVFISTYVPSTYRSGYTSYEKTYGSTYSSQIKTAERAATYKSSSGSTVKYSPSKMGGGSRASFGGGTRCDAIRDSLLKPQFRAPKGGYGGGRGGGGSFGGGSRGGTGGRTTFGGGSRSGGSTTSRNGGFKSGGYGGC